MAQLNLEKSWISVVNHETIEDHCRPELSRDYGQKTKTHICGLSGAAAIAGETRRACFEHAERFDGKNLPERRTYMDQTERKMTKIAREVGKFTVQTMKEEGIGTAEFDFIHLVRHNPGITQTEVREKLKIDKGAAARRAASLEAKGYLERKPNPADGRSQLLFATKKAEELKNSKAEIETIFYEWLLAELPEDEKNRFCETLDKLYWRSKNERRAGFETVSKLVAERQKEESCG